MKDQLSRRSLNITIISLFSQSVKHSSLKYSRQQHFRESNPVLTTSLNWLEVIPSYLKKSEIMPYYYYIMEFIRRGVEGIVGASAKRPGEKA